MRGRALARAMDFLEFLKDVPSAILGLLATYNYVALLGLVFLEEAGVPLPISGDILLIISGYHAYLGTVNPLISLLAVEVGSLAGGSVLYFVGQKGGHILLLKYGKYIRISPSQVERVERWLQRNSGLAIIVGRLIPGLRPVTSFVAGTFEVGYRPFLLYTAIGSLIWATPLLLVGYVTGLEFDALERFFQRNPLFNTFIFGVLLIVVGFTIYFVFTSRKAQRAERME